MMSIDDCRKISHPCCPLSLWMTALTAANAPRIIPSSSTQKRMCSPMSRKLSPVPAVRWGWMLPRFTALALDPPCVDRAIRMRDNHQDQARVRASEAPLKKKIRSGTRYSSRIFFCRRALKSGEPNTLSVPSTETVCEQTPRRSLCQVRWPQLWRPSST
jgi:hypothetical protein